MSIELYCDGHPDDGVEWTMRLHWTRTVGLEATLRRLGVDDHLAAKPFSNATIRYPGLNEESGTATLSPDGPRITAEECQAIADQLRDISPDQARDALTEARKLIARQTNREAEEPSDDDVHSWMKVVRDYASFCERSAKHGGLISIG